MTWKSVSVGEEVHREIRRLKDVTRWPMGVIVEKAVELLAQQCGRGDEKQVVNDGQPNNRNRARASRQV